MEHLKGIFGLIFAILFLGSMLLLLGPLALVVAVVYTAGIWLSEFFFYRRMAGRRRVIRFSKLLSNLDEARGTLMVEQFAMGWGYTQLWWTQDNVEVACPFPLPYPSLNVPEATRAEKEEILNFTVWMNENYFHPSNGRAMLVRPRNGRKLAAKLLQKYPAVEFVEVWTGGMDLLRWELESEPANAPA